MARVDEETIRWMRMGNIYAHDSTFCGLHSAKDHFGGLMQNSRSWPPWATDKAHGRGNKAAKSSRTCHFNYARPALTKLLFLQ